MSEILESPPEKQQFGLFFGRPEYNQTNRHSFEKEEAVAGGGV